MISGPNNDTVDNSRESLGLQFNLYFFKKLSSVRSCFPQSTDDCLNFLLGLTLKTEATCSSETLVCNHKTTLYNNTGDLNINQINVFGRVANN